MSGPDWATVNPGLVRIFSDLAVPQSSATRAWSVEWRDRPLKAQPVGGSLDGISVFLRTTMVAGVGDDDARREYVPNNATPRTVYNDQIRETIYGLRRVTLNVEAHASKIADGGEAMSILERIRTRLSRTRVRQALLDLDVALVDVGTARPLPGKSDQRVLSRAGMDVVLTMLASDTDPVPIGWIATLSITSKIEDTSGVVLPAPPNVTNRIITLP